MMNLHLIHRNNNVCSLSVIFSKLLIYTNIYIYTSKRQKKTFPRCTSSKTLRINSGGLHWNVLPLVSPLRAKFSLPAWLILFPLFSNFCLCLFWVFFVR